MGERDAFEARLAEDRYDVFIRSLYADWLEENGFDDEAAEERRKATPEWCEADKWLRKYAENMNPYDLNHPSYEGYRDHDPHLGAFSSERAFRRLIEGLRAQELFAYGSDLHGLYELDDADELKRYAEVWLGKEIDYGGFTFSCSC